MLGGMKRRYPTFRATKTPGLQICHRVDCPAAFEDGPRCRCEPTYRAMRRDPVTKKPTPSKGTKDKQEALNVLRATASPVAVKAIRQRAREGRTFASLADEWMDGVEAGRIQRRRRGKPEPYAPTTWPGYKRDLENILKPEFGPRPADGIDDTEWQTFFDRLARDGLSYSRLANIKAAASSVYAWASGRTRRLTSGNPVARVELPPNLGQRRTRCALGDEAMTLLERLDWKDRVPYAIAFYAGPRRGEIARLGWEHVQFVDGEVGYWLHFVKTLGKTTGRDAPIPAELRMILQAEWLRQGKPTRGRVSPVSVMSGKHHERAMRRWGWERTDTSERWQPDAGIVLEPVTLHECRHTYASWLMAAGYSLKDVMEFMGHADLVTTDRYVKALPRVVERPDAAGPLNDYLARVHAHAT